MNRSQNHVLAAVAMVGLIAAGCGSASSQPPTGSTGPADLTKAKQQAQQFHTISMPDDWNNYGPFFDGVCQHYALGCTGNATNGHNRTDASDASSAEVIQSFKDDKNNPGMCGDIGVAFSNAAVKQGVGLGYAPAAAKDFPKRYVGDNGAWFADVTGTISFLVNTDKVSKVPTSWADLTKPEYKGQVFMKDPTESGTGQATVLSAAAAFGKAKQGNGSFDLDAAVNYFKQLKTEGQFTKTKFSAEAFERGETPISLAYDYVNLQTAKEMNAKGIHTQVVIPAEGGVWAPSVLLCNKNTNAPDLAKLTEDYALSDEGQKIFAAIGAHPIRYVLGDLQLSADDKKNWLPESAYANVKEYPGDSWPDASELAQRWTDEVANG